MGSELPPLSDSEFERRIRACSEEEMTRAQLRSLLLHYRELRRWNPRLSLVGPQQADEVVERHYGESLAALPLLPAGGGQLVDLGSGAGFPGMVLAAMRPQWSVWLFEARARKWSFLESAARKASLSCRCVNARVGAEPTTEIPTRIDVITSRAVALSDLGLETLETRLAPRGKILLWSGGADPAHPAWLKLTQAILLSGARSRRILVLERHA